MFDETTEGNKREWFQSLSLITSEEESDGETTSDRCMLIEVQNANLRFPYPMFSDVSDNEIETCVSNNQEIRRLAKRSNASKKSQPSASKPKTSNCKYSTEHVGHSGNSKNSKQCLRKNQSRKSNNSKSKFVRDELKSIWNYTKRKKKQHVFCRPGTAFSTSEEETEPVKKKHKKTHGRIPQLIKSSSEEHLDENGFVPKSELIENSYIVRSFSTFIDSSSNSETSECKENKLTNIDKKSLCNSAHNMSSSDNTSDSEPVRSLSISWADLESKKFGNKKRVNHSISSSEGETKQLMKSKDKTKSKKFPSSKTNTYVSSKHPFRNLITAQQLQEDNRKMKIGLKPTCQREDKLVEVAPKETQKQPFEKVNSSLQKKMTAQSLRTNCSKKQNTHKKSKLQNLKKQFISVNKSSVELSRHIRSNMSLSTKEKVDSNLDTTRFKNKLTRKSSDDQPKEIRSDSNIEETSRICSNDNQEVKQKEAKYTVNVNVYCNRNQLDASRSVQDAPVEHSLNNSIGNEPSHNLDINLSVIQEEEEKEEAKSTFKKVRISHTGNHSKNKPHILYESNSESKLNKKSLLDRESQSIITSNENKPAQYDLVGNIISQMKTNPYPCQTGRRKSLEQGTDALRWFSKQVPSLSNTQAPPIVSNNVSDPNKGPTQYLLTHPSAAVLSMPDPLYHQSFKPPQTSSDNKKNIVLKKSLYINNNAINSSLLTQTDKATNSVLPLAIANKHSRNEVIKPFYSADQNDYVERPENPQNNMDKRKGLNIEDVEHLKLCSGDRLSVKSHWEGNANLRNLSESQSRLYSSATNFTRQISDSPCTSETHKERIMRRKSGSTDANIMNNSCTASLDKTYQTKTVNTGIDSAGDKNNVNNSLGQIDLMMPHCSNNAPKNTMSEKSPHNHFTALECEQSALKKGVRIRIQGNEFRVQQTTISEDSALSSQRKKLTNKLVPISNLIKQTDALNSSSKETQNSSSDSDEDSSSSNDSSSSASSSVTKNKTGESDSYDGSSSPKIVITEQDEEVDHSAAASYCAENKINNIDVEIITLDSSSDDEFHTLNSVPMDVNPPNGIIVQNKLDYVQPQSNSAKSESVTSIFDPVDDCDALTNIEGKTNDASIFAVANTLINVSTNDHSVPSSSNSCVGKIRVKSLKELGVDDIILQPENALINTTIQDKGDLLKTNTLLPTTNEKVEEAKTGETSVGANIQKTIKPLRIKLDKVTPVKGKLLYKVQSTIDVPKKPGESQINMIKNKEKSIDRNSLEDMSNSNKLQSKINACKLPSSLGVSSEPTALQNTIVSKKNITETSGEISYQSRVSTKQNQANIFCFKTGENSFRYVQQESNKSKSYELTKSNISNVSNLPQNSQMKKPIPNLVALKSSQLIFIPTSKVVYKVQAQCQTQPMPIMHLPSTSGVNSNDNRSNLSLGEGQRSSSYHGVASSSNAQQRTPEDIAVPSTIVTESTVNSKQALDKGQSQQTNTLSTNKESQTTNTHLTSKESDKKLEELFFKLCDELFFEVILLKIPKMVDDLHLIIIHEEFKEERLKKTEQLLSPESILSEKNRAERDFHEQIRIRAHSFVPLFTTVVNKIHKNNLKTLVIALYIRFINQLQAIDPKYAKYRLPLRYIIKAMLQKSGSTSNDVCQILSENDSSFSHNYIFIENLLAKYDQYVEQRRAKEQTNNQQAGVTETDTSKRVEGSSIQQSKENNIQQKEGPSRSINTCTTINASSNSSTPHPSNQNPKDVTSLLPANITNSTQIESTSSNISESTQKKNLDLVMFDEFFKTNLPTNLESHPPNAR